MPLSPRWQKDNIFQQYPTHLSRNKNWQMICYVLKILCDCLLRDGDEHNLALRGGVYACLISYKNRIFLGKMKLLPSGIAFFRAGLVVVRYTTSAVHVGTKMYHSLLRISIFWLVLQVEVRNAPFQTFPKACRTLLLA